MALLLSLTEGVVDLVLPARCAGCGAAGRLLCPACRPGPEDARSRWLPAVTQVVSAGSYDGALRAAVLGWKERGRTGLTRVLGPLLVPALAGLQLPAPGRVLLVPVPSSAAARRARGGDLVARLARVAGARAGLRRASGALLLTRTVADSAGLGRRERAENLRGAFTARAGPPGVSAVLVDDIVTTGTTLTEAASALLTAGWAVAGAVTIASTPRPGADTSASLAAPIGRAQHPGLAWERPEPEKASSDVREPSKSGGGSSRGGHGPRLHGGGRMNTVAHEVEIVVRGRNVVVPDHFRQHVEDKLTKLERYDGKIHRADVELQHEKNPRQNGSCQHVEITLRTRGPVVRSEACAEDFYKALDMAVDRLERRLRQAADRRRIHHGRRTPPSVAEATANPSDDAVAAALAALDDGDPYDDGTPDGPGRIVREKEHTGKPMTVDDALEQMELVGHNFFMFNDADSGRPSVVYRRRAYDYGIIRLTTDG